MGLRPNLYARRSAAAAAAADHEAVADDDNDDDVQVRPLPLADARRLPEFSPALAVFLVLLLADLVYLAAHVAALLGSWRDGRWLISQDGGYAEQFQYQKFLLLALLTGLWALWQRRPALLAWTAVFTLLWVDDKFLVHEYFGLHFADLAARALNDPGDLPLRFGPLAAKHLGELIAAGGMGVALLALIALAYRNGGETFRRLSVRLVVVVLALGVCGVFFDLLHHIPGVETARLFGHRWLAQALTLLEDGGEMLTITAGAYIVLTAIDAAAAAEAAGTAHGPPDKTAHGPRAGARPD